MTYIRRPKIMEQLFGDHVPIWLRLLTLLTFPVWGMFGLLFILSAGLVLGMLIVLGRIFDYNKGVNE